MATISPSDAAPAESVRYTFAGAEFDLGGSEKRYETDDVVAISNAQAHPWLSVEVPEGEVVQGVYVEQLSAADDGMSRVNSVANDPEAARAAEEAKADENLVAIEAGTEQTDPVVEGDVALTLAADRTSKTFDKVKEVD